MKRFFQFTLFALFLLNVVLGTSYADELALPATDVTAPVLELKNPISKIEAGKDYQILVTATDNTAVKDVIIFYRVIGSRVYQNKIMRNVPNTDDYTITLSADELQNEGVEYYIQGTDPAGNTLLLGYAFSPIAVAVEQHSYKEQVASSTTLESKESEKEPKSKETNKWLWIGLGVLAVGAIAASSGGGGGGGGGGSSGEPTVVVNAPVP